MRHFATPVLCAAMLIGAAFTLGCASTPPPAPGEPSAPPPSLPSAPAEPAPAPAETAPAPASTPPAPSPTTSATADAPRHHHVRRTSFEMHPRGALKLPGIVDFETDSDKISSVSDDVLEVVHDYLDVKPEVTLLRVEGHTDTDGNEASNQALSEKRAMAVARWLVGVGVKCDRIIPVGFGQKKPLVPNDSPEHKAENRRVDFVNAQLNGKPIGATPTDGGGKVAGDPCH